MPTIRDVFRSDQLRWSDVSWGPVDPGWPAISFATGTTAWSQLKKLDENDVVLSVCAGQHAEGRFKRRITGISVPHRFTALTRDIVHPDRLREAEQYGPPRVRRAAPDAGRSTWFTSSFRNWVSSGTARVVICRAGSSRC
jgi:hypothetical protein